MRITFNPAARQELVETARWYTNEAGGLRADDFKKEVQRSLKLIIEHPALGAIAASHTHSMPVHRYPYSVIYRVEGGTLRVLAVVHHSRRPGYWMGRR